MLCLAISLSSRWCLRTFSPPCLVRRLCAIVLVKAEKPVRRLEPAEGRLHINPSIPLSSLIYRLLASFTIAFLALRPISRGGCFTLARAASPLQRVSCARSFGSARASAFAPNKSDSTVLSSRYPRHQRVRVDYTMSSSDDTPLVKANDGGEFACTRCFTYLTFTSRNTLPTRRSPNLAIEAFSTLNYIILHLGRVPLETRQSSSIVLTTFTF